MKYLWLSLLLVGGLLGCNSSGETRADPASSVDEPAPTAWSYEGVTGPTRWGDLDPAWILAKTGRQQSPIDIVPTRVISMPLPPLVVNYPETGLEIRNNGHTVETDYHDVGTLTVGDQVFRLAQFHFHSPSEHTIAGKHLPLELHLVHKNDKGDLAVIAVLIEEGAPNAELTVLLAHLPTEPGSCHVLEGVKVNASKLLPPSLACFRYAGSLTTPPCSEKVSWFVLRQPITASASQIGTFRKVIYGNNRPTQPLNGRSVFAAP